MARAPVSNGLGHPGPFHRVPLSQCFRAKNTLPARPSYQPVLPRVGQLVCKSVCSHSAAG
jgi:hypothetical protein